MHIQSNSRVRSPQGAATPITGRWKSASALLGAVCAILLCSAGAAQAWWDKAWSLRKEFMVDTTAGGVEIAEDIGAAPVLLRLHGGNFQFLAAKEDGSDIRLVAEDGETLLTYHIEKFDPLFNEGFLWVRVPDLEPGKQIRFWLYYGNPGGAVGRVDDPKGTYDEDTIGVYHFTERGTPAVDSVSRNNATIAGAPVEGAMIGTGLRLLGGMPLAVEPSATLEWEEGQPLTWSIWFKQNQLQDQGILWSRTDETGSLHIGVDQGIPFAEVRRGNARTRTPAGAEVAAGSWRHLAMVADGRQIRLFLDGELYSSVDATLPEFSGPMAIGGEAGATEGGFVGEVDEMQISRVARPEGWVRFSAINQGGSEAAGQLLVFGEEEGGKGHNETLEHVMLFGDIAKNMMFDGWIAVGVCILMILTGWTVAAQKFLYLNKIQKGTDQFLRQWKKVAADLTVLDRRNPDGSSALESTMTKRALRWMRNSPLFHVYHIGSEEIRHRIGEGKNKGQGLSARSIQAIRASMDAGMVREHQRLNKGIVLLTISIAGGPYVGLLGTVVGVMITFALIAKTGEVEVNSIAPGIASALLATTAGLAVAIPALFMYSYLNARITDTLSAMQVFIDEFVAKIAEFYPTPADAPNPPPVPAPAHTVPVPRAQPVPELPREDPSSEEEEIEPENHPTK